MLRWLQNYPHALEIMYVWLEKGLEPFRRWLTPESAVAPALTWVERAGKEAVFDCRMCGQCILHSTGMTCPMSCPKNLRNGPCGGVRANGHCEVKPEMRCVWVEAFERSRDMPIYGDEILQVQPPVNRALEGTSAWINMLHGVDAVNPEGWVPTGDIPTILAERDPEIRPYGQ